MKNKSKSKFPKFRVNKPKKCKASGKTQYPTEEWANQAMIRLWSRDPHMDIKDMHTYLCPDCKTWHFGHKSYYEQKLKRLQEQQVTNGRVSENIG